MKLKPLAKRRLRVTHNRTGRNESVNHRLGKLSCLLASYVVMRAEKTFPGGGRSHHAGRTPVVVPLAEQPRGRRTECPGGHLAKQPDDYLAERLRRSGAYALGSAGGRRVETSVVSNQNRRYIFGGIFTRRECAERSLLRKRREEPERTLRFDSQIIAGMLRSSPIAERAVAR